MDPDVPRGVPPGFVVEIFTRQPNRVCLAFVSRTVVFGVRRWLLINELHVMRDEPDLVDAAKDVIVNTHQIERHPGVRVYTFKYTPQVVMVPSRAHRNARARHVVVDHGQLERPCNE